MRTCISILIFLLLIFNNLKAQEPCGFDDIHRKLLSTDPAYALRIKANENAILSYINNNTLSTLGTQATLYTIPVVVHVVHTGGEIGTMYNPTDAQIIGAIDYLNSIFNGTHSSLTGGVGDIQIQFALAQRDPNCNPTNGINRVDGSVLTGYVAGGVNRYKTGGSPELSIKNLTRWNTSNYYNIWIINKIDGVDGTGSGSFIAGFAYFPGSSSTVDGTMMLATQMKSGEKTLPHEIGHALNLYHVFEGSANSGVCPNNSPCLGNGDRVCDTDPISFNKNATTGATDFSCRTGNNSCTNTPYNAKTESNFMNYTNCYTLFTADQKTRMLAAMSLSSRSSLVNSLGATPTFSSSNGCTPRINFSSNLFVANEIKTSTDGCRKYTDYTLEMTIGNTPTQPVTVTLLTSGTATELSDYIVTTNGNYNTPNKTITFPAGSRNNQQFTVRIFDDEKVESTETIVLNFNINNNGGNGVKGTAFPTQTISIKDNDFNVQPIEGNNPSIGNNNYSFYAPFGGLYSQVRMQALYTPTELTAVGLTKGSIISKLNLTVTNKKSTIPYSGFNIGLKHVSNVSISNFNFQSSFLNVYSNNYTTQLGNNGFPFSNNFIWDGVSSILVDMCYSNATSNNNDSIAASTTSDRKCIWVRQNTGTGCTISTATSSVISGLTFVRPDIIFTVENPVAKTLNTSVSFYLGPNEDVIVKSGDSLMARIKNKTAFDYGCTNITIDRTGNGAVPFWIDSSKNYLAEKTFTLTPTFQNPTGEIDLTLFYNSTEINGWNSFSGRIFDSIQLINTALPIKNTNPTTINGAGLVKIFSAEKESLGTLRLISETVSTESLSFGVGTLSDKTYTFTGSGNWSNASNWLNGIKPPTTAPNGSQIIINPAGNGECIIDESQTFLRGSLLSILPNKKVIINNGISIQ